MLNCFKDHKRCINIFSNQIGFWSTEHQIHNATFLCVAYPTLSIPCLLMPCRLTESQGVSRHGIDQISWNVLSLTSEELIYETQDFHTNSNPSKVIANNDTLPIHSSFVSVSMGLSACNSSGHLSNHADIAPNHAGITFAISNTLVSGANKALGDCATFIACIVSEILWHQAITRANVDLSSVRLIGTQFWCFCKSKLLANDQKCKFKNSVYKMAANFPLGPISYIVITVFCVFKVAPIFSVHEHRRTCQTFPMARPKCLMRDFTILNRIYKAHRINVWWTMKVFRQHCIFSISQSIEIVSTPRSIQIKLLYSAVEKCMWSFTNRVIFGIMINNSVLCVTVLCMFAGHHSWDNMWAPDCWAGHPVPRALVPCFHHRLGGQLCRIYHISQSKCSKSSFVGYVVKFCGLFFKYWWVHAKETSL